MSYPPQGVVTKTELAADIATHAADLDAHILNIFEQTLVGQYYPGGGIRTTAATVMVANRLNGIILWVPRTMTFDRIGIYVSTADAGNPNARLGLYNLDTSLSPVTLIRDYGVVNVGTTGLKVISQDQQLDKGYYLPVCVCDGTPTLVHLDPSPNVLGMETGFHWGSGGYIRTFTYATLPDPFGGTPSLDRQPPAILLRTKSLD